MCKQCDQVCTTTRTGLFTGSNTFQSVLTEEVDYIKSHQQHWVLGNIAKSEKETEELLQCYRRIETSFRQLQVSVYY